MLLNNALLGRTCSAPAVSSRGGPPRIEWLIAAGALVLALGACQDEGFTGASVSEAGSGGHPAPDAGPPDALPPEQDAGAEERCVTDLRAGFSLGFEEVPLDDEPEEVTDLLFLPGRSREFLLLDKQGRVRWYELESGGAALLGKFELLNVEGGDDCGAVSLALDPLFDEHPYLYIGHCVTGQKSGVTRVRLSFSDFANVPETARRIIELGDTRAQRPWHNVGSIGFDDDSVLWALFGEKTIPENSQDLGVGLGKLVRVIPNRDEQSGGFEPASGNFASALDPSVYALGLRSPWKGARDENGRYFVADVGASDFEEINLIDEPGENLGWPLSEGPCTEDCDGLTEPLVSYGRSADERYALEDPETRPSNGRAIWIAGPFASVDADDPYSCNLDGLMLFGDFFTGWVRALRANERGAVAVDQAVGHLVFVSTAAQDETGVVYLTTFGNYKGHGTEARGRLYRAVARP